MRGVRAVLAPGAVWLALFAFAPLAIVVAMSFAAPGRPVSWELSGDAWRRLLDPAWVVPLRRSLWMAAATTAVCLAVGTPLALFIARRPPRARAILYFLVVVPLWANTVALVYAWMVILRVGGLADQAARAVGLIADDATLGWMYTPGAVLLGLVYTYLPFAVYAVYAAAERFDWTLIDAAEDLGATRLRALVRVFLPGIRPGLVGGAVLVFLPSLAAFVVPDMLGGAKTALIGNVIQDRFRHEPLDWPLGAALSVALLIVVATGIWAYFRWGTVRR